MADEQPTVVTPPASPATPPAAPPATVPIDPVEYANLKASHAALEAHKAKVDREREKERAERAREKQEREAHRALLIKAGILPDDTSDPSEQLKKREDAERAAREAETSFELSLYKGLLGKSLLPKDGEIDFVVYKIRRDPELAKAAESGVTDEFIESLKARGYVSTPSAPAPVAPPPATKPDAKAAAPAAGATPADPTLAAIKNFQMYTALPYSRQQEIAAKNPEFVAHLRAMHSRKLGTAVR